MPLRHRYAALVVLVVVGLGPAACDSGTVADPVPQSGTGAGTPEALSIEVVSRRPHDPAAFTQGFAFGADGRLYESLGIEGRSSVREVDPATGDVVAEAPLDPDQFGEGLAIGPDGLVQLTWKNGVARRWTLDPLRAAGSFAYDGEGWGLTFDGDEFWQSDGSATLTRRDPSTFEPTGTVEVERDGAPVDELNELEWVDGVIYANVWHSDEILRIDPGSGTVTGVIDAAGLWTDPARTSEMTLNGIARHPDDPADRLWLTGKNWPEIHVVDVVPA